MCRRDGDVLKVLTVQQQQKVNARTITRRNRVVHTKRERETEKTVPRSYCVEIFFSFDALLLVMHWKRDLCP